MKLSLNDSAANAIKTECVVIGLSRDGDMGPSASAINQASEGMLGRLVESGDVATGLGKVTLLQSLPGVAAQRVIVVGFGKAEELDSARYDRACLAMGSALGKAPFTEAHVCVHELPVNSETRAVMTQAPTRNTPGLRICKP